MVGLARARKLDQSRYGSRISARQRKRELAVASSEASHGSVFHDIFVLRDARIIEINARFFETAISGE